MPRAGSCRRKIYGATATRDPRTGDTALFVVNRHTQNPVRLEVRTTALGPVVVQDASALTGPDPLAANRIRTWWPWPRSRWKRNRPP